MNHNELKISVGIIARNEEEHIEETLKSVINQKFPKNDYEIIIVDGNSYDNTRDIAFETLKNSGISFKVLNEKDFGFYGHCFARNLVIDNSDDNTNYIAFIDGDCIADENWLMTLYKKIDSEKNNEKIAGVGGNRLIAPTKNNMELLLNSILTSYVATGGNPAFANRKIEYIESIPNYNAIYKKEILKQYRFDESLIISDDIELNYRLIKNGYKFIYEPNSKIYHHETSSIVQFSKNMFRYGKNATNVVKKYKNPFVRSYVPLTALYILSILAFAFWYIFLSNAHPQIKLLFGALYFIYALFLIAAFFEVIYKVKKLNSVLIFIILPVQHISYGLGVIYGLTHKTCIKRPDSEKNNP